MIPEAQERIDKAHRSLEVANMLLEQGHADFSASRAYYAMFYAVEALLSTLKQQYSSHAQTLGAYGKEFAKTGKLDPKFHRWLLEAEEFRTAGDYEMGVSVLPEDAEKLCRCASEFITAAEAFFDKK